MELCPQGPSPAERAEHPLPAPSARTDLGSRSAYVSLPAKKGILSSTYFVDRWRTMPLEQSPPLLLFFTTARSGPARRMESLLAHLARKERTRLRISKIDVDEHPEWVERLKVTEIPTLVLVKDRKPVERLEGRVSAPQIERMIAPHLPAKEEAAAA